MKKIRLITIFFAALMVVNGFNFVTYAWDYPLDIDVVYISFNYNTGSYSEDALSIIPGYGGSVIQREWDNGGSTNLKFAYIKSQTNRKIQVQFWHNQNQSQSYNFAIGAAVAEGTSFGDVPYATVSFPSNNNGYSEIKTYQLNGTVAGSVGKRYVKFTWWCVNEALSMGYTGNHYYYTLLAAPQSPMAIPWVTVLDYACDWASGETTTANVAQKVTEGIYYMGDTDGDIDYDYASYYCTDYDKLLLSDFLDDVNSISNVKVNCTDCGNLVNVFTAAAGCQSHSKRIWYGIYTKEIDPIGSSFGWGNVSWSYHQYGWLNNLVNDASLRLDRYGTPRVPTNMSQNDYNSLLINGAPPPNSQIYTTQIVN